MNLCAPKPLIFSNMLDERSKTLRRLVIDMVEVGRRGHIGSAMSLIEIIRVLYDSFLQFRSEEPNWPERDRFILSKGHGCLALYAVLADKGFFDQSELRLFCKPESILGGHPERDKIPGVEASTGSLGHGISFAVGKALLFKNINSNRKTFVIISDGELNEGSTWESILFASHHKLKNLTIILDYNKFQSLDRVEKTIKLEPLINKIKSFNMNVINVNGHNHEELKKKLRKRSKSKPSFIIANTIKGKGVSFMENNIKWHYKPPDQNQLKAALKEIN